MTSARLDSRKSPRTVGPNRVVWGLTTINARFRTFVKFLEGGFVLRFSFYSVAAENEAHGTSCTKAAAGRQRAANGVL